MLLVLMIYTSETEKIEISQSVRSFFFLNKGQEHCQIMLEGKESLVLQLVYYMNKKHKL